MFEFNKLGNFINDLCNLIFKLKLLLVFFWLYFVYLLCVYIIFCVINLINIFFLFVVLMLLILKFNNFLCNYILM